MVKTMFIITDYTLLLKEKIFLVKSDGMTPPCPECRGHLCYRDSRLRIRKKEGGSAEYLVIRRFRCEDCGRYHNELPDCLVPYKHYEAEVVSGVLDGVVSPDDLDSEDFPCAMTMFRWICWLNDNLQRIEGYLRLAGLCLLGFDEGILEPGVSLLSTIRNHTQSWLERILRIIYNSGGYLVPVRL